MNKSNNIEVQQFLEELLIDDYLKHELLQEIRKIVFSLDVNISERMMYGGIMFTAQNDIGGIFKYKNHVSFEFGDGYKFEDPSCILEGNGEFRRHVKIKTLSDIKDKNIESFVKQAIENDSKK